MAELKIGYRAVFYIGEMVYATYNVKETYEEAVKDIEHEHEQLEKYADVPTFTHAQVEKVYFRH